jgi:hypothetical protein
MNRSDYNNNPGNLRPPKGVTYDGQIGVDDKGFAVFENKDYGRQALINDINHKIDNGIDTPEKFVDRFAPASNENTEESRNNYKIYLADKLGLKSTGDPFPKNASDQLATAVGAFESGTWNKPDKDKKSDQGSAASTEVAATDDGARVEPVNASGIPGGSSDIKPALGVVGGGAGLGTATTLETTKKVAPLVPNIINALTPGREVNPNMPQSRLSLQRYLNSQIAPNLKLPLSELEKVSGAGKIRTMSEVQNALKAIQAVEEKKVAKPIVRMVPGRPGVFEETGQFRTSTTPRKPGVDLTQYEMKPSGPVRQAVGRELATVGEVGKAVAPSISRIALGGLGGAGAVMSGYDAYELSKKIEEDKKKGIKHETYMGLTPDEWRLATKSAATVGGGLSMMPFGLTQLSGLAMSAPELGWSVYDWYKNRGKPESSDTAAPLTSGLPAEGDSETLTPQ